MEEVTVDCLIDEGTRTWNTAMVDGIFAPQEAEEIKNILLGRKDTEDSLYWPWEHDGRINSAFPPSADSWLGCFNIKGTRTCLPSSSSLFGIKGTRYEEYKALKLASLPSRPKRRVRWKPPDQDTFKINFDGVIFAEDKCSGLGVIIRNQEGLVIASMSTQVPQQLQPIEIEALAASNALGFAREVGISEAVLEGNSSLVMTALKTKNPGLAPFGLSIQDSLSLSSGFSKLYYSHTKREGNIVAQSLA
nr:hypothetical protein CFP56_79040 [Quercus suber]